jgi:cyclopropane-fatty-acyl-phospholipid synthase
MASASASCFEHFFGSSMRTPRNPHASATFTKSIVETLREHYALTLRQWVKNLQEHASELLETVSERTLRTWLLYTAGSAAAFERGDISVCQALLRRRDHQHNADLCVRASWYVDSQSAGHHLAA